MFEETSMAEAAYAGPVVDVRALTRIFGAIVAVDHVSLEIARGEIFGLIGPNGAGKSTLIRMLTTLLPPTSGSATVARCDVRREPAAVRRRIGYVPQLLSADGALTGYENLLLSARLYGVPRSERATRIAESMAKMGVAEVAHHLAGHYSGGMVRRLEIAQSLLHRPEVLFLDEPTVGLDPAARDAVWDRVVELRERSHTTMIVTSHHMDEIDRYCDRIALIARGRIAAIGTPAELKSGVGPGATLDDVFTRLTAGRAESETEGVYGEIRRSRRAVSEHG
ncbi:MAG: ABC transporter ATP-binding protein [Alphaproteobacteria bacterium]